MPSELHERYIQQFNDTQNRYRYDAHINLLFREDLKPYLKNRFKIGKPLDEENSFQIAMGDNYRTGTLSIPEATGIQWTEAYNQAVGLQGLEVADVHAESRSQEDTGGSFSGDRLNRG